MCLVFCKHLIIVTKGFRVDKMFQTYSLRISIIHQNSTYAHYLSFLKYDLQYGFTQLKGCTFTNVHMFMYWVKLKVFVAFCRICTEFSSSQDVFAWDKILEKRVIDTSRHFLIHTHARHSRSLCTRERFFEELGRQLYTFILKKWKGGWYGTP